MGSAVWQSRGKGSGRSGQRVLRQGWAPSPPAMAGFEDVERVCVY